MKPPTASAPNEPATGAPSTASLATKGREVEEWIDLRFFRPIGIRIARVLEPTRVSPDQVTLWSLIVGLAAGHCFLYPSASINALGFLLFIVSDLFDSADGQLARLRGTSTQFGRILDGVSDNARFLNLYAHVMVRLVHSDAWGWPAAVVLTVLAGLSHSWQSAAVDCIRHAFLEIAVGKGSELELPEDLAATETDEPRGGFFARAARGAYRAYVKRQSVLCAVTVRLVRQLRALDASGSNPSAAEHARAEFRARERGVVPQCAWLGQNIRFALIGVPSVLGWAAGFLWLTVLPLNAILLTLVATHERRAARVLRSLGKAMTASPATVAAAVAGDELHAR